MDLALTQSLIKQPSNNLMSRMDSQNSFENTEFVETNHNRSKANKASKTLHKYQTYNSFHFNNSVTNINNDSNRINMESNKLIKHINNNTDIGIDDYNSENEDDKIKLRTHIEDLIRNINIHLNINLNSNGAEFKRLNTVIVYIYLVFLKIGEIDTIKERFQADAYIESRWEDSTIDPKQVFDSRFNWNPELHIENAIGDLKQEIRYKIVKSSNSKIFVHEMRSIKGIFWERLELWDFPLDMQELSITISTSRNVNEISFEQDPVNECKLNTEGFQNEQEWNLFSHISSSKKVINDLWRNCQRPCFTATALVSRKPGYFIYNAYMLVFFVSALGFVPFSFAIENNHFRIQVTSLLILTSVNFRWIVTQRLPTVSYLTTLDKYAIGALIFLVLLCAWHSLIGSRVIYSGDSRNKERVDRIVLIVLAALYVLYHIIYIGIFYMKYRRYGNAAKIDENNIDCASINKNDTLNNTKSNITVLKSIIDDKR